MSRYMDTDVTIKKLKSWFCDKCYNYNGAWCRACLIDDIICAIDDEPTADVEEVKHGRWIRTGEDGYCSVCKCDMPMFRNDWKWEYTETPYCPNCGAKMDEVEE